jgi:putative FmdB family regulatory protein
VPTYEYACTACGHRLEAVQRFSDDPLTECPECGGALRKVYGAVGIVLKGSGFYRNDSRVGAGANGSNGAGSKDGEKSKSDSSSTGAGSNDGSSEKGAEKGAEKTSAKTPDSKGSKDAASSAPSTSG